MRRIGAVVLGAPMLLALGCPSAYHRTYEQETKRLEAQQQAADAQAKAQYAEASRYAAVVYFEVGRAVIGADGQRELRWFAQKLQPYPQAGILVQGFADTTGSEATNQALSTQRAEAVATYLAGQGIDRSRLVVQGFGTESPAASNASANSRSRNRRVEVTVR